MDNTIRIKKRFLFLPKKIGTTIKWMTIASWMEKKTIVTYGGKRSINPITFNENPITKVKEWIPIKWIDNDQ